MSNTHSFPHQHFHSFHDEVRDDDPELKELAEQFGRLKRRAGSGYGNNGFERTLDPGMRSVFLRNYDKIVATRYNPRELQIMIHGTDDERAAVMFYCHAAAGRNPADLIEQFVKGEYKLLDNPIWQAIATVAP